MSALKGIMIRPNFWTRPVNFIRMQNVFSKMDSAQSNVKVHAVVGIILHGWVSDNCYPSVSVTLYM